MPVSFLQEALTNIAKHAQATQVWVNLASSDHSIHLTVKDNGRGFDLQNWLAVESHLKGIGLLGMRERLEALGGSLAVESQPGQGACLTARLPRREFES
ncbi:MAG: hypothetical protein HC875_27350 [Anaerolineales bacterium]|nr:hypothetical protein [Anaerolineales bacterium]